MHNLSTVVSATQTAAVPQERPGNLDNIKSGDWILVKDSAPNSSLCTSDL